MRAASRAIGRLFAAALVLTAVAVAPSPAVAQAPPTADPHCPSTVGGLPLSVMTPFSGTVRPVGGDEGERRSVSLLCAYGEGVESSAEVTVTWEPNADDVACGDVQTVVAPSVRSQPFARAGRDLLDQVGTTCPDAAGTGVPVGALAAAGGALVVVVGVVLARRRRRRVIAPAATPEPEPDAVHVPLTPVAVQPEPAHEPASAPIATAPVGPPDAQPVLATLSGPSGRAFARTGAGQWATVSAVAYAAGNPALGDLARAGALLALQGRGRPRADVAVLARTLAHQPGRDGR